MAGQRLNLSLGTVSVEVALDKSSSDPKGAKWDVRVPGIAPTPVPDFLAPDEPDEAPVVSDDPMGPSASEQPPAPPVGARPVIPQTHAQAAARDSAAGVKAPERVTQRGVVLTDDEGESTFIDLTDRIAEIDAGIKADAEQGMQIVAAIPSASVPRERVRDACFVRPIDDQSKRACAMLYHALGREKALVVRWTKRTRQALGIITASAIHGCLLLLEVEFAANMQSATKATRLKALADSLTPEEKANAERFVETISGRKRELDDVVDERARQLTELLTAAREGKLDEFTLTSDVPDDVDAAISAILAGAAA